MRAFKRAVLRKGAVLIDTLADFRNEVLANKWTTLDVLRRYNRRIAEELVDQAEKQQLPAYLGLDKLTGEKGQETR